LRDGESKGTYCSQRLPDNGRNGQITCLSVKKGSEGATGGATRTVHVKPGHTETSNRGGDASSSGRYKLQVSLKPQLREAPASAGNAQLLLSHKYAVVHISKVATPLL